jgi:DNA polymerase III sliding clamp (beta) subunit (PCNA family)
MLVSNTACEEIIRLGNPTRVLIAGSWAVWDYTNLSLLTRLREGAKDFPDVGRLMQERASMAIPPTLLSAMSRLALFANGDDQSVTLRPSMTGLEMSAENQTGSAVEYLDVEAPGQEMKGINPKDVLAALPYAEGYSFGAAASDLIYLRGSTAGFEFVSCPMRKTGP